MGESRFASYEATVFKCRWLAIQMVFVVLETAALKMFIDERKKHLLKTLRHEFVFLQLIFFLVFLIINSCVFSMRLGTSILVTFCVHDIRSILRYKYISNFSFGDHSFDAEIGSYKKKMSCS